MYFCIVTQGNNMENQFTDLFFQAAAARACESNFNEQLKTLQTTVKENLTPIIGKMVKVTYYTTDAYAIKYGRPVQEFVGTLEGFSRNGFLHIMNHNLGVYQNIRPMRIIDIKVY